MRKTIVLFLGGAAHGPHQFLKIMGDVLLFTRNVLVNNLDSVRVIRVVMRTINGQDHRGIPRSVLTFQDSVTHSQIRPGHDEFLRGAGSNELSVLR